MTIKVEEASDSDALRAWEIRHAAYTAASNSIEPFLFPGPFPPGAHEKRATEAPE